MRPRRRNRYPGKMLEGAWTFRKAGDQLRLERCSTDATEVVLVVEHGGKVREYHFATSDALDRFQHDMQTFLVHSGWSLAHFTPERRRPRDRRSFPRETNDRRRWWTDGAEAPGTRTTPDADHGTSQPRSTSRSD